MKLSKEELIEKINSLGIDDEIKISLMEDISDSVEAKTEPDNTELEELKAKYEELKEKYKARFLEGSEEEKKDEEEKEDEESEELKEEEVIDVKEI